MRESWSLILNVLLLVGVIVAIGRMLKARRRQAAPDVKQPSMGTPVVVSEAPAYDDIIAVRKISSEPIDEAPLLEPASAPKVQQPKLQPSIQPTPSAHQVTKVAESGPSVMMFLLAKENRFLAGYELLQTVLAAGLRFGEGHLFHRHQYPNGQGPVLCSLAAATASGVFDLQNIGAFSVRGLCLFMQASGNPTIDADRFAIMLDTAKQLSEGLDTHLLDNNKQALTDEGIQRYYRLLNLDRVAEHV